MVRHLPSSRSQKILGVLIPIRSDAIPEKRNSSSNPKIQNFLFAQSFPEDYYSQQGFFFVGLGGNP